MRDLARIMPGTLAAACLALALPALFCRPAAAAEAGEFAVKAAYVYNFIQLTGWPARGAEDGPVKVAVVGGGPLAEAVGGLAGRKAGGRVIEVSTAAVVGAMAGSHVVVFTQGARESLPDLLWRLEDSDVLTVGDLPQFARKGGIIGFVTEKGRVRIELNPGTAKRAGLKISARLMEVARLVR